MLLLAGSVLFTLGLLSVGLPGAWLLGPMMAGVVIGVNGGSVRVPPVLFLGARPLWAYGCWPGYPVRSELVRPAMADLSERDAVDPDREQHSAGRSTAAKSLPGTTAIWGLSPGAASAMMLLAEAHGGDPRLVAFMQYLRVVCVAFLASLIARFWIGGTGTTARPDPVFFPALHVVPLAATLAIAGSGMVLARWVKIPSGVLIVPMVLGSVLHVSGVLEIDLPRWLLVGTFAGARVERRLEVHPSMAHAARASFQ